MAFICKRFATLLTSVLLLFSPLNYLKNSGLQCANSLVYDHGIDPSRILLLDAHNYVGGRVKQTTDFVKGFKIDLGNFRSFYSS